MGHPSEYPANWPQIAEAVKLAAAWHCIRCAHIHAPEVGRTLTVHHLDMDKANCRWWNLAALCQACHLSVQVRVVMERPYMFEHALWFRPYVAGWYAATHLGLPDLTRGQVMVRLDELLALGRVA